MDSANLLHNILTEWNRKHRYSGNQIERMSLENGDGMRVAQKMWSNLTREDYDPEKHGYISIQKLDALSMVTGIPPWNLIAPEEGMIKKTSLDEMIECLQNTLATLREMGVISEEVERKMAGIADVMATILLEEVKDVAPDKLKLKDKLLGALIKRTGVRVD